MSRKTRNILKIGKSSLAITLPKKWVQKQGLKEGDEVVLEETTKGYLIIRPGVESIAEEGLTGVITIGKGRENSLERIIIAYYQAGYTKIKVKPATGRVDTHLREAVRKSLRRLIGLEIIEEGTDYITLETIVDTSSMKIDKVLSRMEILVLNSAKDLRDYTIYLDKDILRTIIGRDEDIDKFYFLLSRQVNLSLKYVGYSEKVGVEEPSLLLPLFSYGKTIERIGDVLVSIARMTKNSNLARENAEIIFRTIRSAINAFRNGNNRDMLTVTDTYQAFFKTFSMETWENYLTGNILSLCLDIIESKIEIDALRAVKRP